MSKMRTISHVGVAAILAAAIVFPRVGAPLAAQGPASGVRVAEGEGPGAAR